MLLKSKSEKGFTLIELIIVIVILGIIAGVAIPKFIGLSGSARTAAARGVGGALSSTISSMHANYLLNTTNYNINNVVTNTDFAGGLTTSNFSYAVNATNGFDVTLNYGGTNFNWHYVPRSSDSSAYLVEIGTW